MKKSNKAFFLFLCFITLPIAHSIAAPVVESVAISGDKLIVTGHQFLDIDGLILSDPQTGFKKPFKVQSATESEIVGTAVDNQKITVASLMNLIIDTAKGETIYPVSFSLQKDAVTNPTIKNGAITPEKFLGVTTPNPPDQTVLTWSQATNGFVFTKASAGGGSSGVSEIVLGPGIIGAPNTASGSVPVSVDVGQTGDATKTKIPYFNSTNKIVLDSTNSPTGALSGLSLKDGTKIFDIINDNGLRIDSEAAKDLLVLDSDGNLALKGPVTVGGFDVCLSNGNCIPSSGLTLITATAPLVAAKTATGTTNISAGAVNTANNLVQLDSAGKFPSTIPGVVRGPGSVARLAVSGNLAIFSDTSGENLGDGGIGLQNLVSMSATPTSANKIVISTGTNKVLGTTDYTIPTTSGVTGQVLGVTATGTTNWVNVTGVTSFNTRTGAVIPQVGDYSAAQVTNLPFGIITATTVQQAIDQLADLDSQKLPIAGGTMTGTITTSTQNAIKIGPHPTGTGEIQFVEPTAAGTNYVGFKAAASIASNTVWTLPAADGSSGTVLSTNGSKQLAWTSLGAAGVGNVVGPSSSTSTNLATFNGTTGKLIQDSGISSNNLVTMSGTVSSTGNVIITGGGKIAQDSTTPLSDLPIMQNPAIASNTIILSAGNSKDLKSTPYTIPPNIGSATYVLKSDGTNVQWGPDASGTGDVVGPASSLDQSIPTFSGTTGKILQNTLFNINGKKLNGPNFAIGDNTAYGDYVSCFSNINFKDSYASPGFCQDENGGTHVKGESALDFSLAGSSKFIIQDTKTTNRQDLVNDGNFRVGSNAFFVNSTLNYVGIGTLTPTQALQIDSTISGFLPPRMTTEQKNFMSFPPPGLIVYDTDLGSLNVRNASGWLPLAGGTGDVVGPATATLNSVARYESGKVIKESGITIDDANNISGIVQLNGKVVDNLITGSGLVGNLPIFGLLPSEIEDSGIASINIPTMASNATAAFHPILSAGNNKSQIAAPYTFPNTACLAGEVLKWNATGFTCQADFGGSGDVAGPATSSSNTLAQFSDSSGKIIKGTAWTVPNVIGTIGQYLAVGGSQDLVWTSFPSTLVYVGGAPVVPDNLPKFGGSDGTQIIDSGIATANVPTMVAPAASSNTIILSNGADKTLKTTNYTIPGSIGSASFVLKSDGTNVQWAPDGAGTGDVVGPPSSTAQSVAIFSGVDGKALESTSFNINGNALIGPSAFMGQNLLQGPDMGCFSHVNFKASFNDFGYCQSSSGKAFFGSGDSVHLYVNGFPKLILESSKTTHNQNFFQVGDFTVDTNTFFVNAATNSVGIGTATPTQVLQIDSTTSGFLPPRMSTAQKNAINPQTPGLVIFDSDLNSLSVRTSTGWISLADGTGNVIGPATSTVNNFATFSDGAGKIIKDSGINSGNLPTMVPATKANQIIISAGAGKQLTTTIYPIPTAIGATGTVLKSDGTNATWQPDSSGTGDVAGPATATLNSVARYESGKVIKESGIIIDDANNISGINQLNGIVVNNLVTGSGLVGNLPIFGLLPSELDDSGIALINIPTMASNATAQFHPILSGGNNKSQIAAPYTLPSTACLAGEVLKWNATGFTCQSDFGGTGDVAGPATSASNTLAQFSDSTGKIIKGTAWTVPNNIGGLGQFLTVSGATDLNWTSLPATLVNVGNAPVVPDNLPKFGGSNGTQILDSGLAVANVPTMVAAAASSNTVILSSGADKTFKATNYTIPPTIGSPNFVLKSDGTNVIWQADVAGTGDVAGPATATLNSVARYESGKVIKESGIIIDDANNIAGIVQLNGKVVSNLITGSGLVGNLPIFGLLPSELEDSGIALINIPNMASNATAGFQPILSGGNNKSQIAAPYTLPSTTCLSGEVLKWNTTGFTCQSDLSGSGDVAGPATSTLDAISTFAGTDGNNIKNTAFTINGNYLQGANVVMGDNPGIGPGYACFSHKNFKDSYASAGFCQDASGNTFLNTGAAYTVDLKVGGQTEFLISNALTTNKQNFVNDGSFTSAGNMAIDTNTFFVDAATNSVGIGTTSPVQAFQIDSITKGFLPPRMTTAQRDAINPQTTGLVIFDTTTNSLNIRYPSGWQPLVSGTGVGDVSGPATSTLNNFAAFSDATGKIIKDSGINSGNLPTMASAASAANKIIISSGANKQLTTTLYPIPAAIGASGTVLKSDGTNATWQADSSGSGDVIGPASATLNSIARFQSGKVIKNSGVIIDDTNNISGVAQLNNKVANNLVTGTGIGVARNLPIYAGISPTEIEDSGISLDNIPTMASNATAQFHPILSGGNNKSQIAAPYTLPNTTCLPGEVLKWNTTGFDCQADIGGSGSGLGDVTGPASATINSVPLFADSSGKVLKTTDYTIPNIICPIGQILKSDGTNFICQAEFNGLSEWVAGKAYKTGEIVNTGSDANWLFKVIQDHTSVDVPADFRAGKIMAIAPPIITTGVQAGGEVSLAGSVATVQGGTGYIAKYGTSPSAWPLISIVEWTTQSINLPTAGLYSLFIDESGTLISQPGVASRSAQDSTISVAIVDMNLGKAYDRKTYPTNPVGQLRGLAFFFGGMSKGLSYTPTVTKELARTAHEVYFWGANPADPFDPNSKSYDATYPVQFFEFSQNGTASPSPRTQLRNMWDDAGTLTAMPGGKWGFARIYSTLGAEDYIMYGQALYANEPDAREAAISSSFIKPLELNQTKFSSWVVFKGSDDDFSDNSVVTCEPFGCDKIGSAAGGGTGGGDVLGPASAIGGNLASFTDTSGKVIQDSGINVADLPNMATNAGALYRPILSADANKKLMAAPFSLPIIDGSPGQILQTNGSGVVTWVDVPVSSALEYPYMFESVVSDADPGNGKIQINNANPSLATFIYVADEDGNLLTVNRRLRFFLLKAGDLINISSTSDPNNNYLFNVTGNAIPATGYVKIPITLKTISGTIADAQRVTVALVLKSVGPSTTSLLAETSNILISPSGFVPPTSAGVPGQMLISSGIGTPATWKNLANFGSSASLPSDKKLKKEIKNLPEGYIERLMDLRPVSFVWRDSHNPDMGFIAQDMSKVFPDLVENNNDILGINYSKLVVPIVKAFQEKVQKDEQTIKMLLDRIERLEKIIGKEAKK